MKPQVSDEKRAFTVKFPQDEAQAVIKEADRIGVTITLLFRLWVRGTIMRDPIEIDRKE